jgi:hypothetical protein
MMPVTVNGMAAALVAEQIEIELTGGITETELMATTGIAFTQPIEIVSTGRIVFAARFDIEISRSWDFGLRSLAESDNEGGLAPHLLIKGPNIFGWRSEPRPQTRLRVRPQ